MPNVAFIRIGHYVINLDAIAFIVRLRAGGVSIVLMVNDSHDHRSCLIDKDQQPKSSAAWRYEHQDICCGLGTRIPQFCRENALVCRAASVAAV